jgi:hypothetical protein
MNMRCMRCALYIHQKECRKSLGCGLSTGKYGLLFLCNLCVYCILYCVSGNAANKEQGLCCNLDFLNLFTASLLMIF